MSASDNGKASQVNVSSAVASGDEDKLKSAHAEGESQAARKGAGAKGGKGKPQGKKRPPVQPAVVEVKPFAGVTRKKGRHTFLGLAFVLICLLPTVLTGFYMFSKAADQYSSNAGFAVRSEEMSSPVELLGGIANLSSGSSSDTDIIFAYIQGPALVRAIDEDLDLRSIFSKPDGDPVFSLDPDASFEELTDYWNRMVQIYYDSAVGLIELEVKAFDPVDAHNITTQILDRSSALINSLSAIARKDATVFAEEDLEAAIERLKGARLAMAGFRVDTQVFDPAADVQGQMGLLNTLQIQLAEALISRGLLIGEAPENDPRILRLTRRIEVIEAQIHSERSKFGVVSTNGDQDFASLLSEYEALTIDLEFAQQSYLAALSAYDVARAESQRKSRYLAPFLEPTMPESAIYPKRLTVVGLMALFTSLFWCLFALFYYSARDRRS